MVSLDTLQLESLFFSDPVPPPMRIPVRFSLYLTGHCLLYLTGQCLTWDNSVIRRILIFLLLLMCSTLLLSSHIICCNYQEPEVALSVPPASCVDDCSTLLGFILQGITETDELLKLKVSELLLVWSDLIADWHAWEEIEDLSIFNCIKKAVSLDRKFALKNFLVGKLPLPPAPQKSILEGIGAFITEAFSQYPSAVWRAASCVHILLHNPSYLPEGDDFKQSLVISLCHAAFSRFRELRSKAVPLWKPLLLAIASCYLCFPDMVENILEGIEHESVTVFLSALAIISTSKFEHSLSSESEIKLAG